MHAVFHGEKHPYLPQYEDFSSGFELIELFPDELFCQVALPFPWARDSMGTFVVNVGHIVSVSLSFPVSFVESNWYPISGIYAWLWFTSPVMVSTFSL